MKKHIFKVIITTTPIIHHLRITQLTEIFHKNIKLPRFSR